LWPGRDTAGVTDGEGDDGDGQRDDGSDPGTRQETDPRRVRTVAVHADDVVAALETNRRGGDDRAVLRVTPPFSGRMRARIHLDQGVDDDTVRMPPGRLVADAPPPPTPDDTADDLRGDPDAEYTRDRHREWHEAALAEWRATARERIVERVRLVGDHTVGAVVIGGGWLAGDFNAG